MSLPHAALPLLAPLATATDPQSVAGDAVAAAVQLNPFGALFTALVWVGLVALNGWCFRKVLRGPHRNWPT